MVDHDIDAAIKEKDHPAYDDIQRFLYHLALCHNVQTLKNQQNEKEPVIFSGTSPDELALINAAKYYGIRFVERNQYNELILENDHHQYC